MTVSGGITCYPPAKVNLFLELLGKRSDGYHELVTVMSPLGLTDELRIEPASHFSFHCDDASIPGDERNLVVKAARLLQQQAARELPATVSLKKRIPHAAGLGGGSSDAAYALLALNAFWKLGLQLSELAGLAEKLGSDVPYFLRSTSARCTGRGERIETLKANYSIPMVLFCPNAGLSTAAVYAKVSIPSQPQSSDTMVAAIAQGEVEEIGKALMNRLQAPAEELLPTVARLRELLDTPEITPLHLGHRMSGSGSSSFALCRSEALAQQLSREVTNRWDTFRGETEKGITLRTIVTKMVSEVPAPF